MHRQKINLNRKAPRPKQSRPDQDAVASSSEIRTSALAVPVPAQEQLPTKHERRPVHPVVHKATEAVPFHYQPSRDIGTAPPSSSRPAPQLMLRPPQKPPTEIGRQRIPSSVQHARRLHLSREQETQPQEPESSTEQSRPVKRQKMLPVRKHTQKLPIPISQILNPVPPTNRNDSNLVRSSDVFPVLAVLPPKQDTHTNPNHAGERTTSNNFYPPQTPVVTEPRLDAQVNPSPIRESGTSSNHRPPQMRVRTALKPMILTPEQPTSHPLPQLDLLMQPSLVEPQPHPQPRGNVFEDSMFQTLIARLDRIAEREDTAYEHRTALDKRLGAMENTLEVLKQLNAERRQNAASEEIDRKQKQKEREEEKEAMDNALMNGQKQILQYLCLLAQRLGDIGKATAETKEILGIKDTSPASAPIVREGIDVRLYPNASINIDTLDPNEASFASAHGSTSTSKPGLKGWQPQSKDQFWEDIRGADSEPSSRGRSVIERLESIENMQTAMAEWWEKTKGRETALCLEDQKTGGREEAKREAAAEKVLQQSSLGLPPAHAAATTSLYPVPRAHLNELEVQPSPNTRSLSTLSSTDSSSTRHNIDIRLSGPPPVSSTSTSTTVNVANNMANSSLEPASTSSSTDVDPSIISVNDKDGADGPLVRIYATGSAGIRLLELAKTLLDDEKQENEKEKQKSSKDAMVQCAAEPDIQKAGDSGESGPEAVAMDVDVFNSRPNLQLDPREESMKKFYSEKTLIGDTPPIVVLKDTAVTSSTSTHPTSINPLLPVSIAPPQDVTTPSLQSIAQISTPSASTNTDEPPPSLKIRIKPIQYRVISESTPTRIGTLATSEFSSSSRPPALPMNLPMASTSDPKSAPHSPSKPSSPITTSFGTGLKFGFSPVKDWSKTSPNSPPLSFNHNRVPISSTPTRTPRLLRPSSRPQAGTSTSADARNSMPLRTPTRTPRKRSSLTESRKAKMDEIIDSQEAQMSSATKVAERAVQGLLDVQAVTPQSPYNLDSTAIAEPITPSASESSSLVINIPLPVPRESDIPQAPSGPSCDSPKEEELDDAPAKGFAERALKGLLDAQAMSPQKPYSVDLDISSSAQTSTILLTDPPMSTPNHLETQTESPFLSRSYTLPAPVEGTIAALRQHTLGHPYVYAGPRFGPPRTDSRETMLEEFETIGMQEDKENEVQASDDIANEANIGSGEELVSVEATTSQAVTAIEDPMNQEHQLANEEQEGQDELMEDIPSEQVLSDIRTPSDSQKVLSSIPKIPLHPLEVLEKSTEPLLDGPSPRDSLSLAIVAEPTFSHTSKPPSVFQSRPQLSPPHDPQLLPLSPPTARPPATKEAECLTPKRASSISHSISTTSIEPKDTIPLPLASTRIPPVLPIETVLSPPMSQSTTTTVDEQHVDSLLMDVIASSSPVKRSAIEPDHQEPVNDFEPDVISTTAQDTTIRCSPGIPSDSPPALQPYTLLNDDIPDDSGIATVSVEPDHVGEAVIERASNPLVNDLENQQPPQYEDQVIRTPSPISPQIRPASPNIVPTSGVDEDLLRPETILQVKTELDALSSQHLTGKSTASAQNGNNGSTNEPEYIYISDSSPQKPPVKSTVGRGQKKPLARAQSIISISSDDDDDDSQNKVKPPPSNKKSDFSRPSKMHVFKIKHFGEPAYTSTPTRIRITTEVESEDQPNVEQSHTVVTLQEPASNEGLSAESILTKELSPMTELSEQTPLPDVHVPAQGGERERTLPVDAEIRSKNVGNSSFDFKKYSARLDADDDVPIIPLKKKRKVSGMSEPGIEDGSVADSENGTIVVKKKSLLVLAKKGRSAAITRVKKRKNVHQGLGSDDEDQPPLKKANLRKDIKTAVSRENKQDPKAQGKGKTREQPVRSPAKKAKAEEPKTPMRFPRGQEKARTVKWPTVLKPDFDQFIKCDVCESWYHIGCVGVGPNDPSLDDAELYTCPPCVAGVSVNESESPHKLPHNFDNLQSNSCRRPKCQRPKKSKKKVLPEEETFVIESFVGRHRRVVGGKGTSVYYLVKWHGYPLNECTWEELDGMGLPNSSVLVQTFERAARDEELDLDNASDEYLLLQEAADAGWGPDGAFIKPE